MNDLIKILQESKTRITSGDPVMALIPVDALNEVIAALSPVQSVKEGEFTSCADVLDDWFNSCNVQGKAEMETVEVEELMEEMQRIERRYLSPVLPEDVQRLITAAYTAYKDETQATGQLYFDLANTLGRISYIRQQQAKEIAEYEELVKTMCEGMK